MQEPSPKDRYVDNGPIRLHYVDWGGSAVQTMVLVHGLRDSARSWDIFAKAMASDYRVISLDSRGHGDSGWAGVGGYRLEDYVADVATLFDCLDLDDVTLVGHSAGGRYAWSYAVQNPARVRALVVVDIDPDPQNPQTDRDFSQIASEPAAWNSLACFIERLRVRQGYTSDSVLSLQASAVTTLRSDGTYTWKADLRTIGEYDRPDVWESWRRITCPTLLVRGRQSTLLTHETAVRMREALSNVHIRLAELEGGGHWFYQDFPGAFEATVRWFLDQIPQ